MNHPHTPASPRLLDGHGRHIHYLRVSVTDRCDMRCTYCIPEGFRGFEEPEHWLTLDEMARLVGVFVGMGVNKVRLTGGEPLLRRGVTGLAATISALPGLQDLSLTTNASQLHRMAQGLKDAGVSRLNVSLDSLRRERFAAITKRDVLDDVLRGIATASRVGLAPVKINTVVQAGVNDDELDDLVAFALEHGLILRLIEPMPMGHTGQAATGLDLTQRGAELAQRFGLIPEADPMAADSSARSALEAPGAGPARYWHAPKSAARNSTAGRMSLGVITPLSQHFCATCNRVRLGVDGTLYLCLGQNDAVPLGRQLREGASDADLRDAILQALAHKPERHHFVETPGQIVRFMSQTGG
ncbi:GTP 3',8-cyclase MoaA [Amphibiibacter pelophylacis]|uniref:GTP 3',8-cyclase MoaA n=1 Tax=Amphibiibacter pelophylacis TaxID=1799477 RepID=A0ACC6NZA5_9BURK